MTPVAFHLAFPVDDLEAARAFYVDALGCSVGRTSEQWIDFDFGGHQITAHLRPEEAPNASWVKTNQVDGDAVPVRHFGLVLAGADFEAIAARLRARGVSFLIEPHVRFRGEIGEQSTMFVLDPSGNAIELKSFKDASRLFASG